jgi:hypothetical protein
MQNKRPFSIEYVLRATLTHMRNSVDMSINKTSERIAEFEGDPDKSSEVFKTLAYLHNQRRHLTQQISLIK